VALALLGRGRGARTSVSLPKGEQVLTIVDVS
jgi:hypothetical protein